MPRDRTVRQFRIIFPTGRILPGMHITKSSHIVKPFPLHVPALLAALVLAGGCAGSQPAPVAKAPMPEILTVREDGTLWFRERPLPERDVIIYPDGYGGEKAAVRIHRQPLHPDFFRDTIVVERE